MPEQPASAEGAIRRRLEQAQVAAQLGRKEEAERLYNEVIALDPENVEAWLGLVAVVEDPEEKRRIYETVLALDPDNPIAREGLRQLQTLARAAPVQDESARTGEAVEEAPSPWRVLRYEEGVAVYACANHPERETTLRCNRCGKPICPDCAVLTDVGYRCRECVTALEGRFYHATPRHVVSALVAAAVLGFLGGAAGVVAAGFIGFWSLLIAPLISGLVAEGIWRAGARYRARHLNVYAAFVVATTGLLGFLIGILFFPHGLVFGLITVGVIVATVYTRTR